MERLLRILPFPPKKTLRRYFPAEGFGVRRKDECVAAAVVRNGRFPYLESRKNVIILLGTHCYLWRHIMGTFLKYVLYLILLIIVFLVGKGIYDGNIDKTTTVGEVVSQVGDGTKQMVKDTGDAVGEAVDNYRAAPKKDIVIE